jgi:hypothetical protein
MDQFCVVADSDALLDLAAKLPAGRLFDSGRALVPYVKTTVYAQLLAAAGITAEPRPVKAAGKPADGGGGAGGNHGGGSSGSGAGEPPATRVGAMAPTDHSQIGIGSIVLAQGDDEDDEGFYRAKILLTKSPDSFILEWMDYDLPQFTRSRRSLALLHPKAVEAAE